MKRVRVAVSGHRLNQLPQTERPRIAGEIAHAFALIEDCAQAAAGARVRVTLSSALAEGADRMAAHAALARSWRLFAPLPFEAGEYEKDFGDETSITEFRTLLSRAVRSQVAHHVGQRSMGYAAANRLLLRGASVLVLVWNGAAPKGPGGTAEMGAIALMQGKHVIWISPDGANAPCLIAPTVNSASPGHPGGRFAARLLSRLSRAFPAIARPPAMQVAEAS